MLLPFPDQILFCYLLRTIDRDRQCFYLSGCDYILLSSHLENFKIDKFEVMFAIITTWLNLQFLGNNMSPLTERL